MPSGAGGSPRVGVSSTSMSSKAAAIWRVTRLQAPGPPLRYAPASRPRPSCTSAQVRGSTSSSVATRPDAVAPSPPCDQRVAGGPRVDEVADEGVAVDRRGPPPRPGGRATRTGGPPPRRPPRSRGAPRCRWASWSGPRRAVSAARSTRPRRRTGPRRGGAQYGSPGTGPGRHVEDGRAVAHRARHHVLADQASHQVAVLRRQRVAPPRRLEADQSAAGGGDADGTSPVVGVRHRHHARGHGGGRSSRRASGGVAGVPRVARRAEALRLGRRQNAELGRVGLPADRRSRPPCSGASAPGSPSSGSPPRRPGLRRTGCRPTPRPGPSAGRARRGRGRRAARRPRRRGPGRRARG